MIVWPENRLQIILVSARSAFCVSVRIIQTRVDWKCRTEKKRTQKERVETERRRSLIQ